MRVALLVLVLLAAAYGVSSALATSQTGVTKLTIRAWPTGKTKTTPRRWTLTCPGAGTLPHAATACKRLLAYKNPFAPVQPKRACTQIYGGPAVAIVEGRFRGQRIYSRFTRKDGCQIARWKRVSFLFPGVVR